jgi:N-acetylmuramoyl-L-alanine amidase
LVLILATVTLVAETKADQSDIQPARAKKVLVLDPGHGGRDMGAGKPDDISEKEVALLFAGLLAEKLKPAYTVHLTRSDDYEVDLMHRPAVANHLEADLFLSIHTAASTLHNHGGMLIAYYDSHIRRQDPNIRPAQPAVQNGDLLAPWDKKALDHREKSRRLAELLKERILEYDPGIVVDIQGLPIVVLEGTTQPALLIEIGYLTNPADLRRLKDNDVLAEYTDIFIAALAAYFSEQ